MTPYTMDDAETAMRDAIDSGDLERIEAAGVVVDQLDSPRPSVTLLQAALWYCEQGLRVFPLSPRSKIPFKGSNGCRGASSNHDVVRGWWTDSPDANIGIATGHLVDVVDVDGLEGQESRARLWDDVFADIDAENLGKVLTPSSGGMHIYVTADGTPNGTHLAPSVDYRGMGGYVVAPPSRLETGGYSWLGSPRLNGVA